MRRTIILAAALAIIVIGLWGTFILLLDEDRLKGMVSDRLSEGLGRKVEIVGSLSLSLFPAPRIEAERVLISGPEGVEGPDLLSADAMALSLRVAPLLRGRLVPGQVHLKGATVSLRADDRGRSTAEDLARAASDASLLADGEVSLEDVTVVIAGDPSRPAERLDIQRIELSRFVMDRNAAFRFRGSIVEPPLVEDLQIDARLHVPSSPEQPIELRDLRLVGVLPASGLELRLDGQLRYSRAGPLALELVDATLGLGGQTLDMAASYRAGERPRLALRLAGESLDWQGLAPALPAHSASAYWRVPLFAARRLDVRAQLRLERMNAGWLPLSDLRVDLRTESSGLGIGATAAFPGGLIEAGGVVSDAVPDSLPVDIVLADAAALFEAASLPPVIDASGEAELNLRWPAGPEDALSLEGPFRLFDGRWEVVGAEGDPRTLDFDELSGQLLLRSGHLDLPMLRITGDAMDAVGWAAVDLSSGAVGGQLDDGDSAGPLYLAGSLAETRLSARPALGGETPDATGESEEASGRDEPRP
jgi:hypothetical protein